MRYLRLLAVIVFLVVLVTLPYPGQTRQAAAPAEPLALATSKRFDVSASRAPAVAVPAIVGNAVLVHRQASKAQGWPEAFDR